MTENQKEPPLVVVSNPVTYLRRWWEKVMGKEGAYFSFRIPPITAFLIAFGFALAAFGIGRYSVKIPIFGLHIEPTVSPTPQTQSDTWKETAYVGVLKYSETTGKYFLTTGSAVEAITLEVLPGVDLSMLIEKRILVVGKYSKALRVIQVFDVKDMEVLSETPVPVPTIQKTPQISPSPESDSTTQPTSVFKPEPTPEIPPPID